MKYTEAQWNKLTYEEKRKALINFQEPAELNKRGKWKDLRKEHLWTEEN